MVHSPHRDSFLRTLNRHAYSYRKEPFTLKSGRKSNHYVNCKKVLLCPTLLEDAGGLIFDVLEEKCEHINTIGVVAGVMTGASALAFPIATALYMHSAFGPDVAWVRPEAKAHGAKQQVELGYRTLEGQVGANTLVVEDVTTTGTSALKAIEAIKQRCAVDVGNLTLNVVGVVTLVDREEGAAELFKAAGIPFYRMCTLREVIDAC